jgi:serine/threonine protein kinase
VTGPQYRLTARIAAGELAETYEAIRGEADRVVIKLFQLDTTDPRYAREIAQTTAQLQELRDPGILHVLELGLVSGRLALVREHVAGFNLGQVLSRLTAWGIMLPTPVALRIVLELLDTLQNVHQLGVTHGSITPGNILLSTSGQPALCDFGALRALWAVPQLKARFSATGRGSYRARELERGEPATPQSDLFSLGAVVYQLLTLREVSPDRTGSTAPRSPFRISSHVDQRLYPLLMRSMETIPQLRYASCAEFSDALRGFLAADNVSSTREDLQKFLGDLFPEESKPSPGGPLPLSEPFSLSRPPELEEVLASSSPLESIGAEPPVSLSKRGGQGASAATGEPPIAEFDLTPPPEIADGEEGKPRRVKKVALAASAAVVAGLALTLVLWRSGADRKPTSEASLSAAKPAVISSSVPVQPAATLTPIAKVDDPVAAPPAAVPEQPEAPKPEAPKPPQHEAAIQWDAPPRKGAGFLTITCNVPAIVSIDGHRVKRHAPLKRYPVRPGLHKILLATLDGREHREVSVRVVKGQLRKIDQVFRRSAARR